MVSVTIVPTVSQEVSSGASPRSIEHWRGFPNEAGTCVVQTMLVADMRIEVPLHCTWDALGHRNAVQWSESHSFASSAGPLSRQQVQRHPTYLELGRGVLCMSFRCSLH